MPYVSPAAVVSGAVISKTTFGDVVKADLDYLANPPACRAYRTTTQSITSGTWTSLALNAERFDTDTMHDNVTNSSRLTIKTAGLYVVTGNVYWASSAAGNQRLTRLYVNNATEICVASSPVSAALPQPAQVVSTIYKFAVNDYVELFVYQDSGGALNVQNVANWSPELSAVWIGLG